MKPYTSRLIAMLPDIARDYEQRAVGYGASWVRESYSAFIAETWQQYTALLRNDWVFPLSTVEPYATSRDMFKDMSENRLFVYTGGQNFALDNPMARYAGGLRANEAFRAVHDVNGHGTTRAPFETLEGELEAYLTHKAWYSDVALPALFSETIGQLAYHHVHGVFVPIQAAKIVEVRF